MKTLISLILSTSATLFAADDYVYFAAVPAEATGIRIVNCRNVDDWRAWIASHPDRLPSVLPSLMDMRTGLSITTTNISDGISNLCARAVAVAYDASTNYQAAVIKVTGNGKKKLSDLRKAAKKNKEADTLDALTARIEMLEALLKQRGIMTPGAAMGEDN